MFGYGWVFKRVNDTFGHVTGDKLLIEISSRLKQCVSHHNLVARMGGDEFSVILRNISNIDYPISIAKKNNFMFRGALFH